MPILEVSDLQVKMGLQQILFGVSLSVDENSIVAVLGSNGVGKTTLMRTISGVYHSYAGRVTFLGENITNLRSHKIVRKGLSQAPEGRQIFSNMSVAENLNLGAYHQPKQSLNGELKKVFELFPALQERLKQKAGSLSGGEQQMLCIGRALMAQPRLLLLDEPSLGLAPMLVKQIFDMIARIRETGTAILLVEQNARAALSVARYAYIMDGGRFTMEGPAAELRSEKRVEAAYLGVRAH